LGGGGGATITTKVQETGIFVASTTVAVTVVDPTGNALPDDGVTSTGATGATPPLTIGAANVTGTGCPFGDAAVIGSSGHVSVSVVGPDGEGCGGSPAICAQ
jgi:hypothetical protein